MTNRICSRCYFRESVRKSNCQICGGNRFQIQDSPDEIIERNAIMPPEQLPFIQQLASAFRRRVVDMGVKLSGTAISNSLLPADRQRIVEQIKINK